MPVQVSYPGVYVEEIPSGLHTITGVATSICAFVGSAPRGPVDTPTEIFSFADFEAIFGGLTLDANGDPHSLGFAVRDFFLNGGSDAIVVRVTGRGNHAGSTAGSAASLSLGGILTLHAASTGNWGNSLWAQVDNMDTRDPNNASLFNLTILEFADGATVKSERFLNVSTNPADAGRVDHYLAANSTLVTADAPTKNFPAKSLNPDPPWPPQPAPPKRAADTVPAAAPAAPAPAAPGPAAPGPAAPAAPVAAAPAANPFKQLAGGADGTLDAVIDVLGSQDAKTGLYALERVDLFNILCLPAVTPFADVASLTPLVSEAAAYCASRRAMYIVDPPASWIDSWSANSSTGLATIKNDLTALRGAIGAASSCAAIYFPRVKEPNPLHNNQLEPFAASGAIAGIFAGTDVARGVWKAPAGLEALFTGVPELTNAIVNAENGKLNEIGVNCLRTFPLIGNVVWGARTLDGADVLASDYKYVPVRRFTLFLEESLYRGSQWVVFEPNDEPLWSQIRLNVGAFMHDLFRQGAFAGTTPQQAYFVQCDSTTTTQTDVNNGIVNIIVGFAPLKPAEFVILKIQQMTGQIQT